MLSDRIIPTPVAPSVATFTVLSAGTEVPREFQVLSIVVNKAVNRIATATLILRDGDPAAQTFTASEEDYFVPGKELELKAGYQGTEDKIFNGVVVSHAIRVRDQRSVLEVVCKDPAFKMTLNPENRYFRDTTESDALEDIIRASGLTAEVEATTESKAEIIQYHCTNWDFVLTRADALGKICITEGGTLSIKAPNLTQTSVLNLSYGGNLLSLDLQMDARNQFKSINSKAWSMPNSELAEAEESTFTAPNAGNLTANDLADAHGIDPLQQQHGGNVSEAELQAWSKARLQKSRLARIRGRAQFQGIASLEVGQLVTLQGVGDRFNGQVFVSAIRHEINNGNWLTDAEFGLDDSWFTERFKVTQPRAAGIIPPVSGLQIGIVTQIHDDPLGEHRVQIRLPLISTEDDGTWARVAVLDAGDTRGSFFRPEIGDEVVVGFLNDDPRFPVITGMLNSSTRPAPLDATEDNHERGFVSRSGMKWLFNDEHNNILLETPDGNLIDISGENQSVTLGDQHGNKIVLDSNGITLESIKDIVLKAATNLEAEGMAVKIDAQSTGEFAASGTLTLKGGLVQIN
jgi:Rhs element Vgr protein